MWFKNLAKAQIVLT